MGTRPSSALVAGVTAGFALAIAFTSDLRADATDDRRALVMLRVLAYDKHLGKRSGDEVRILVLSPDTEKGAAERARWTRAFGSHKVKLDNRTAVVSARKFESLDDLERTLTEVAPAAMIVCDGVTAKITVGQLVARTRAKHVMSITTREDEVKKGVAVGILAGKPRDQIVVNVEAATAEGVKFDAGLLQLARKVEGQP